MTPGPIRSLLLPRHNSPLYCWHPLQLPLRWISTSPPTSAPPKTKPKSSEEPKTKQVKGPKKKETTSTSSSKAAAKEATSERMLRAMIAAFDAPVVNPPEPDEEEKRRRYVIGRNYVIGCFERHNEWNHDLAVKIRMKRYAVKMLPREGQLGDTTVTLDKTSLGEKGDVQMDSSSVISSVYGRWRTQAMTINYLTGPPDNRRIPMLTPPIPGFDINKYLDSQEEK